MNDVTIQEELILFIRTYLREYTMPVTRDAISQFPFSDFFHDEPNGFNFKTRQVESFTIAHLEQALLSGTLTLR